MRLILLAAFAAALAACTPAPQAPKQGETVTPAAAAPDVSGMPAGAYALDATHSTLVFRVSHLGFSLYTMSFDDFTAQVQIDPANPSAGSVTATIQTRSLSLPAPPAGFKNELLGPQWLDAARYPQITFRSTSIEPTGPATARITGDLTLRGVTKPIVLNATYNGGYAGHPMDPHARAGFSATGSFKRSDFGISFGVPEPGTTMGVGDEVQVAIETEFSGPAWTPPAGAPATPAQP